MLSITFNITTPDGTFDMSNYDWIDRYIRSITKKVETVISEDELSHIAYLVQTDIVKERILGGKNIFGSSQRALKPATIKAKRSKGQSTQPLIAEGVLKDSILIRSQKGQRNIYVGGSRAKIAIGLHQGTSKMRPLPFFGVSKEVEKEIDKYINEIAKRKLNA